MITIEESTRQVVIQSDLVTQAGAALEAVDIVVRRIAESISEINHTAGQQAEVSTRIAHSMEDIAGITSQTRDSMEQMRSSMEHLAELADSLLRGISVFRLNPAYHHEVTGHLSLQGGSQLQQAYEDGQHVDMFAGANADDVATEPMIAVVLPQPGSHPSQLLSDAHSGPRAHAGSSLPTTPQNVAGMLPATRPLDPASMPGASDPHTPVPPAYPDALAMPDGAMPPPSPGYEQWGKD